MAFPCGFVWGAATSAYQVEGAAREDGKGPSIWDVFCRKPGAIWREQDGDTACDHYHRYLGDVGLMRKIGLQAYRFSISWPRVFPLGCGDANPAGLDFYDRLVDALLAAGIAAMFLIHIAANIGMQLGMAPVKGMTLPFVSYGGSSMVINFAAVGILQSIHMRQRKIAF